MDSQFFVSKILTSLLFFVTGYLVLLQLKKVGSCAKAVGITAQRALCSTRKLKQLDYEVGNKEVLSETTSKEQNVQLTLCAMRISSHNTMIYLHDFRHYFNKK